MDIPKPVDPEDPKPVDPEDPKSASLLNNNQFLAGNFSTGMIMMRLAFFLLVYSNFLLQTSALRFC